MKTILLIIASVYICVGCTSNTTDEYKEGLANNNQIYNCEMSTDNFNEIKIQTIKNYIVLDGWAIKYNANDQSLSYQESNEEIFVVFAKENGLDFITVGKTGFTISTEEQKKLFCQTLNLIQANTTK